MVNDRNINDLDAHWYFGGIASGIACLFTHPVDLVRINKQSKLDNRTSWEVANIIVKNRGLLGLYFKLWPSIMRQLTYSVTRFGIYETAKNRHMADSVWRSIEMASVSGLVAGYINTPMERVNVHMRTDATRPAKIRRDDVNIHSGLRRLYAEGGIRNLFCGATISSARGMVITVFQIPVYDQAKEMLITEKGDTWETYFKASIVAGAVSTLFVTPIEVVKNIVMDADPKTYKGPRDVIERILRQRGFRGLFAGIMISFLRAVPHTTLTFLIYEMLRRNFGK